MYNIIELDLFSDWLKIAEDELKVEGYQTENIDSKKIPILYFTLQKMKIRSIPRKILKSDIFMCPSEMLDALNILEEKIINGDDLRPYQSRLLKNIENKDGLLFDWGIHHLHLGTILQNDGFINRTGPLLYVRFYQDTAYFIDVLEHGAWTKQDLLKIIHRNFSSSIEEYKVPGIDGLERNYDDEEIKHLRDFNSNTLLEIAPGEFYFGPGGGFVGSGDSGDAVNKHIDNHNGIKELEAKIKQSPEEVIKLQHPLSIITNPNLVFNLIKRNDEFILKESNNNFEIKLQN
ncbi:hypothetical protein [Flavobacterium pectinovorum]|uniref:hypothetical protein n=1 Tax=Flavobacterium pectinovorum TaxID=29533 RepID=UPI001FAE49F8|nr:hypothetical protein [Flavobacterium pectinovorum]MCI9843636.1 hypothetical protein [Flavobacterium pectinovorum]